MQSSILFNILISQTKKMKHRVGEVTYLDVDSFSQNWHQNTDLSTALFLAHEVLP